MFDADSSHTFYWDIEDYIQLEKQNGWFTKHRRLLELFGKYLRSKPGVIVLRSAESRLLGVPAPTHWDLGQGELQGAHYDNGYAGERELKAGLIDGYPVLIDSGSEYMEPDIVASIRKYVEAGGVFVALHNTGVHTALDPNSFPAASLTGFRPSIGGKNGKIIFGRNLPIFKEWEGKEFEGSGVSLECSQELANVRPDLSSADKGCVALARWADGGVAVGYRQIGKGRVIVLGSAFWRQGRDLAGAWRTSEALERAFLERLLTDSGVTRNANATAPEIWARKMQTKNGLQEWLLAVNSASASRTADVWMQTDRTPAQVFDLETNASVEFTAENGGVLIKNVNFGAYDVKAFGARKGTIIGALPTWWREKTFYWKRTPEERAAEAASYPAPTSGDPDVMNFEAWSFKSDPDNKLGLLNGWTKPEFDDSSWKTMEIGPWNLLDPALADYQGAGLYRRNFVLPPDWSNKQVLLSLYSFDTPIVYDVGRFFINGVPVADYKTRGWSQTLNYDISGKLHPGENVLAVKVTGQPQFSGISGAVWLEARQPLEAVMDLRSRWRVIAKEGDGPVDVASLARIKGRYLTRDFEVPAQWKGQTIYLELSSNVQWLRTVVINGRPINYNSFLHPFGLRSRINLTPYLKTGGVNKLMLVSAGDNEDVQLNMIGLGYLPPAQN